jgi:hypothetical protein
MNRTDFHKTSYLIFTIYTFSFTLSPATCDSINPAVPFVRWCQNCSTRYDTILYYTPYFIARALPGQNCAEFTIQIIYETVLTKNPSVAKLVNKSLAHMQPEDFSQQPSSNPYPERQRSVHFLTLYFSESRFNISTIYAWNLGLHALIICHACYMTFPLTPLCSL